LLINRDDKAVHPSRRPITPRRKIKKKNKQTHKKMADESSYLSFMDGAGSVGEGGSGGGEEGQLTNYGTSFTAGAIDGLSSSFAGMFS
jgi:hypothetical protein